jgi:hypothetical protein
MHRVGWIDAALDELAAIWVDADPDMRQEITAVTLEIDRQLGLNPTRPGNPGPVGVESSSSRPWESYSGSTTKLGPS